MAAPALPFAAAPEGVRVALRVTPKAARPGVGGVGVDAAGRAFLKVRVGAAPEAGKANAAVIKLLAKAWGLPPSSLRLAAGAKDRSKTVLVEGDSRALMRHLQDWIGTLHD